MQKLMLLEKWQILLLETEEIEIDKKSHPNPDPRSVINYSSMLQ
jgi:hypothetical protein